MRSGRSIAGPANTDLAIETIELVKRFPAHTGWRGLFSSHDRVALDGVSIQVRRGEVFGLLGPNGAGKTTLMKILATLVRPNAGRAFVNGLDVAQHGSEVRRCIGVAYGDERTFFWRLSVRENLRFYGALYRVPSKVLGPRIDLLLREVGLGAVGDLRMDRFSTGMKQRAAIARGLLTNPDILFMDEPTRSLDPVGTHDIWDLIAQRVLDGQRTVLLATNNMEEAERLCDRVALINRGEVRLMGRIPELGKGLFSHDRIHLVVTGVERAELCRLERVPGVLRVDLERDAEGRWEVDLTVDHQGNPAPEAVRHIVNAGGSVWSCVPQSWSLDEIFRLAVRGHRSGAPPTAVGSGA